MAQIQHAGDKWSMPVGNILRLRLSASPGDLNDILTGHVYNPPCEPKAMSCIVLYSPKAKSKAWQSVRDCILR